MRIWGSSCADSHPKPRGYPHCACLELRSRSGLEGTDDLDIGTEGEDGSRKLSRRVCGDRLVVKDRRDGVGFYCLLEGGAIL